MYPVEFPSEAARHTLDLSTARNKVRLLTFSPLVLLYVCTRFSLPSIMFCSQPLWARAAPPTGHQGSGSVPLGVAVPQGGAVVGVSGLPLADQLRKTKISLGKRRGFPWRTGQSGDAP